MFDLVNPNKFDYLIFLVVYFPLWGIAGILAAFFSRSFRRKYIIYKENSRKQDVTSVMVIIWSLTTTIGCAALSISSLIVLLGAVVQKEIMNFRITFPFLGIVLLLFIMWFFYSLTVVRKISSVIISFVLLFWLLLYFMVFAIAGPSFSIPLRPVNIFHEGVKESERCNYFKLWVDGSVKTYIEKYNFSHGAINLSWADLEKIQTVCDSLGEKPYFDITNHKKAIIRTHKTPDCPYYLLDGKLFCKIHDKPKEDNQK